MFKRNVEKTTGTNNFFPPFYNLFLRMFKVGVDAVNIQKFLYQDELIHLCSINYNGPGNYKNSFSHFFGQEEIYTELERYHDRTDDYHKQGFIKIGLFEINDSILLGIEETYGDEIWKLNGDWGHQQPYIEKLAANIFEFVNDLEEELIMMNLTVRQVRENQLYQNWGEDFWRIRE